MRERSVEARLTEELGKIGLSCIKFNPDNMNGMPDRLVVLPGERVVWVELKTDGGAASTLQQYRHRELRAKGQRVVTLWCVDEVMRFVRELSAEIKKGGEA